MADLSNQIGGAVVATTGGVEVILKRNWSYGILHTGKDVSDTNAQVLVAIGLDGNAKTASRSIEDNKKVLAYTDSFLLPPYSGSGTHSSGQMTVTIKSASGAPVIEFIQVAEYRGGYQK